MLLIYTLERIDVSPQMISASAKGTENSSLCPLLQPKKRWSSQDFDGAHTEHWLRGISGD